jgi:hypothetical protein
MKSNLKLGDKVELISFHNTIAPPKGTADSENYWKLIGLTGSVASNEKKTHPYFPDKGERVLVKFDADISAFGLHCHNEQERNTLWIFLGDLTTTDASSY